MELLELAAVPGDSGRLDAWLAAQCPTLSRSALQGLIEQGLVTRDGAPVNKKEKVAPGAVYRVALPAPQPIAAQPQNIPLDIVYEDDDLLVVNTPKGMVVHPAPGNETGTLVNAIMYHIKDLSGIGGEMRPGIVHRIDKLTSGLIVIAKNDNAHRSLAAQMKTHEAGRVYLALVNGNIKKDSGTIDAPIGRHRTDRKKMAVRPDGRSAITHFSVLERLGDYTLIAAKLETGRTHQIRVHMAHIKHPVAGDNVYGPEKNSLGLEGQALHAARLTLRHPSSGETLTFRAAIPEWFTLALKKAGHDSNIDIDKLIDGAKFDG